MSLPRHTFSCTLCRVGACWGGIYMCVHRLAERLATSGSPVIPIKQQVLLAAIQAVYNPRIHTIPSGMDTDKHRLHAIPSTAVIFPGTTTLVYSSSFALFTHVRHPAPSRVSPGMRPGAPGVRSHPGPAPAGRSGRWRGTAAGGREAQDGFCGVLCFRAGGNRRNVVALWWQKEKCATGEMCTRVLVTPWPSAHTHHHNTPTSAARSLACATTAAPSDGSRPASLSALRRARARRDALSRDRSEPGSTTACE
jgi:hypothetical protein